MIIKYFFIYFCCFYVCFHLLNYVPKFKFIYFIAVCYSFLLSFITVCLRLFIPALTNIVPTILLWIFIGIYLLNPKLTFITTLLSLAM